MAEYQNDLDVRTMRIGLVHNTSDGWGPYSDALEAAGAPEQVINLVRHAIPKHLQNAAKAQEEMRKLEAACNADPQAYGDDAHRKAQEHINSKLEPLQHTAFAPTSGSYDSNKKLCVLHYMTGHLPKQPDFAETVTEKAGFHAVQFDNMDFHDTIIRLAQRPELASFTHIDFRSQDLRQQDAKALADYPCYPHLEELHVSTDKPQYYVAPEVIQELSGLHAPKLKRIQFGSPYQKTEPLFQQEEILNAFAEARNNGNLPELTTVFAENDVENRAKELQKQARQGATGGPEPEDGGVKEEGHKGGPTPPPNFADRVTRRPGPAGPHLY